MHGYVHGLYARGLLDFRRGAVCLGYYHSCLIHPDTRRTESQSHPSSIGVAVEIQGDISGLVYPDLRCGPSPNNEYMTLMRAASWGFQLNHFKRISVIEIFFLN